MRYVQGMLLGFLLVIVSPMAWAGSLDSTAAPTSPDSGMYTLEDIFNRLDTGAEGTKRVGPFVEPGTGPTAGTGKTLNEVMEEAPKIDNAHGATADEVTKDKTFWGLTAGEWGLRTGTLEAGAGAGVPKTGQTPTVPLDPAPPDRTAIWKKAWPGRTSASRTMATARSRTT